MVNNFYPFILAGNGDFNVDIYNEIIQNKGRQIGLRLGNLIKILYKQKQFKKEFIHCKVTLTLDFYY